MIRMPDLNSVYRSAFKLIYAHDDHVARILFVFLNIWWAIQETLPVYRGGIDIFALGAFTHISTAICLIGVLIGFLLILFRENETLITLNYVVTILLLLTGVVTSIMRDAYGVNFGALVILAGLCILSYIKYSIKSHLSTPAIAEKLKIDAEIVHRNVVKRIAQEEGLNAVDTP